MEKPFHQFGEWIETQLALGAISFSLKEVKKKLPMMSETAILRAINRQIAKGHIVSIYKSYYLIIPPQYKGMGILPPILFIDELMGFIGRPYYVGLVNAAVLHGATHQQPQEFYVVTNLPNIRPIKKKGVVINFICQSKFNGMLAERRKTETGSVRLSSPEQTAIELIEFEKRVGGLSRVASILDELHEAFDKKGFDDKLLLESNASNLQRLGYIMERVIGAALFATKLHHKMEKLGIKMQRIKLKSTGAIKGCPIDEKWNIIVNAEIEKDL